MDYFTRLEYNLTMIESTIDKITYRAIYRLLDTVSPVDYDCGRLCGAACCTSTYEPDDIDFSADGDENADSYMGLYLLPGEEQVFDETDDSWIDWGFLTAEDYEFPESWSGKVPFIQCRTAPVCRRERRPIQCRTFPLAPHIDEDGMFCMIIHADELPYSCPLIDSKIELNGKFIKATYTCWKHLIRDPKILDLVLLDSEMRIEEGTPIVSVYPPLNASAHACTASRR